jgi:indole-3-glycerol phosphate synthase
MSDFLAAMARGSAQRAAEARQSLPEALLRAQALERPAAPPLQLHPGGFDLIAEVKRYAPSVGALWPDDTQDPGLIERQVNAYVRGGAKAISVLTEPETFHGTLGDLTRAAQAVPLPVMRKDFLVDPYQILEARAAGAGGVLLILQILDDARLREMLDAAAELGLFVLLEAFGEEDLSRAVTLSGFLARLDVRVLVGLNARNLATLEVDGERVALLSGSFPDGLPRVAESGIETAEDAARVAALGYGVALVGSALMRSADPAKLTAAMIEAGRAEAMRQCTSA